MYETLPLSALVSHPLAANRISRMYAKKLRQSIASGGFYETLIVRPHPIGDNTFEILNGHVRKEILNELGLDEVRCDVWDVDDKQAAHYLAVLNKLRGTEAPELRMQLLFTMLQHYTKEELAACIPETASYLGKLEQLPRFEEDSEIEEPELKDDIVIMHFYVTKEQHKTILRALDMVQKHYNLDNSSEALSMLSSLYLQNIAGFVPPSIPTV
jgi:ParB-like chromosome segregation protein Spo0J